MIEFYGGYEVYSESGVDLTLLRENLRQSLEERWRRGQRALEFTLALQQSGYMQKETVPPSDKPLDTREAIVLLKLLAAHHVRYVIVGEQAMHAHGAPLMTEVIDICYQRTPANLGRLVAAIASLRPSFRRGASECACHFDLPTLAAGMNFPLLTDCGYINLLGEVSGIGDYDQVVAQSVERNVYGLNIRILSVDGLIAAKKAAGRIMDQLHLLELIGLKKILHAAKPTEPTP